MLTSHGLPPCCAYMGMLHFWAAVVSTLPRVVAVRNTCSTLYSPTPVIRTSVIRNLDYPNAVPNVESVKKKWYSH